MTTPEAEPDLTALADRIARGETRTEDLAAGVGSGHPARDRLRRLARVAAALDRHHRQTASTPDRTPERIGPWRVLRLLGRGGMGDVWLGERDDGVVDQRVAIKCVRADLPQFTARLAAERRILARLTHPNIARFVDAGVGWGGVPWLAMEYVPGRTLLEWYRAERPSLRERIRVFIAICQAVEHAHRHLVVHRDLKPGNVLIDAAGQPKLLDFGIAKLLDDDDGELTALALTPAYAAPEQLRGEPISTATDVYALGLMLFHLLAEALPSNRRSAHAAKVLAGLASEELERPSLVALRQPDLPYPAQRLAGDLDAIVAQALRPRPEHRYGSAGGLAADLERYLAARPIHARPATWGYRLARLAARQKLAFGLAILALLSLLGGSLLAWTQWLRAEREARAAQQELARAEQVSEFLITLFREQDPLLRAGAESRRPDRLLAGAVERVRTELASDPIRAARLLAALGEAQLHLDRLSEARQTLELAEDFDDRSGTSVVGAEIAALLGVLALRELKFDAATAAFDRARRLAFERPGGTGMPLARIEAKQALALVQAGRFAEAKAAAERAVRVMEQSVPIDHPERIGALIGFGVILEQLREDAAAEDILRQVIGTLETHHSARDARLIRPLSTLGELLLRARRFDEARAILERGAALAEEVFGGRHGHLGAVLIRLATLERQAGRPQAAIDALDRAERAWVEGDDSGRAQLLATRGAVLLDLGQAERAADDLSQALALRRQGGGDATGLVWFTQAQLGQARMLQGRLEEAEALQAEAARELSRILPPEAYQHALIAQRWAQTLEALGRYSEAAAQWRIAVERIEAQYGLDHYGHLDNASRLAAALAHDPAQRTAALDIVAQLLERWPLTAETAERWAALTLLQCRHGHRSAAAAQAKRVSSTPDLPLASEQREALERCAAGR